LLLVVGRWSLIICCAGVVIVALLKTDRDIGYINMSVYSRIFAATSKKWISSGASGRSIPAQALWAFPGLLGASWFIWGALSEDIQSSVGLYWDPDVIINKVEAEREHRMEAREAAKASSKPAAAASEPEEEDEEEEEEEAVTVKDIEEAVNAAVEESGGFEDNAEGGDDDDAMEEEEEKEEEEEEEEKPKPKRKKFSELSQVERWDRFMAGAMEPGEVSLVYLFIGD
jgi:hypothetical protein